ncbi:unnamed protein product [Mucor hiemalis]
MRTITLIQFHILLLSSIHLFFFFIHFLLTILFNMKFIAVSSIAALLVVQQVAAYPFIEGCLQNHTVTAVDGCTSIAAQYKITEAEFYAMNPGLHHSAQHDCDNLDSGKNYCVCLKAPCPVANAAVSVAPAASAAANATASASAVSSAVSSAIASASSSAIPSSSAIVKASASSVGSAAASATSPATTKSSATTTSITAITAVFAMTATAAMLF